MEIFFPEPIKNDVRLLIFDLDGTLADTIESIREGVNLAMRKYGFPERSYEDVRRAIGGGARNLIYLSMPAERAEESVPRNAVKKMTKAQTLRTPRAEEVTAFVKSDARSFTSLGGSVLWGSSSLGKTFFDEAIFIPILTVAAETRVAP